MSRRQDRLFPNYQNAGEAPEYRPNGGDLVPGDMWYDEEIDALYIYTGTAWAEIGGPGRTNDIYNRIEAIDELNVSMVARIEDAERRLVDLEDNMIPAPPDDEPEDTVPVTDDTVPMDRTTQLHPCPK